MRFERINIPEELTIPKGIEEINIQRLSNVIAFVGKNGSGKSRILDLIEEYVFSTVKINSLIDKSISKLPTSLEKFPKQVLPFKEYFILLEKSQEVKNKIKNDPNNSNLNSEATRLKRQLQQKQIEFSNQPQINSISQQITQIIPTLKLTHLRRIRKNEIQELEQVMSDNKDTSLPFETLIEKVADSTQYDELKSIHKSALKFLAKLPHQLAFDKYECIANNKVFEDRISYKRFQSLKKFVKDFINKELSWEQQTSNGKLTETGNSVTFSGIWKVNDRVFNYNEFSNGEKTLFAYALLFFLLEQNPNLNIKESVILIDEPELHLHPDSEIDLIDGIKNVIGDKGQLIIATHSINILSMLNYEEIFMVKNGAITHPSQITPGKSLSELMGIEERVHKLSDFLSSISTWAYVNFMAQCFSNPEVIESARAKDPQIEAFKKAVMTKSTKENNMLLDFGAGKGRLYEQIKSDYEFLDRVNYSALEPEKEFHDTLKELGAASIFTTYEELPKNTYDFILLCNVLHEIPLEDWVPSINKLIDSLNTDGYLIFIEAKILSRGEKIGQIGYLLLDLEELQQLFRLASIPPSIMVDNAKDSITCVVIQRSQLAQISEKDVLNAVVMLEENTLKKIEVMRGSPYEGNELYGPGRKTAFLSQQYINARFAHRHMLKILNKK